MNIAIRDPETGRRPSVAISGTMSANAALRRLALGSGLEVRKVGPRSFVLSKRPVAVRKRGVPTPPTLPPPPPPAEQVDIVVTASKRDSLSSRFAGQWTRVEGEALDRNGVAGLEALEAQTVGVSSTHLGAGRNKLFIRGIADSSFSGPTQSPVGFYFGDMRTGYSGPDPDLKLVDLHSAEILEGPQGTLYGSGALGGIVLLKPNMPGFDEAGGSLSTGASLTWHGDPGHDITAMLNLPTGPGSGLRLVGYQARDGGYVDNRATAERDVNAVSVRGGRAIYSVEVRPGWFVDLLGIGQRISGDDSQYADRGPDLSRSSFVGQPFDSDYALVSLAIRKDGGTVRFRSTSGISFQDVDENFDSSIGPRVRQLRQHSRARTVSNETRVWRQLSDGYGWLLGFSTLRHRYRVNREIAEDDSVTDLSGAENELLEATLYAEGGVEILPRLEASIGARFTLSEVSATGQHLSPMAAATLASEESKRTEHRLLPSAALLARPVDGLTVYARYQQGFRPGGLSIAGDNVRFYRKDRLASAEFGLRYRPAGPFDLQASVTRSRWNDIQADFLGSGGLPVTENIGDGRVWTLTANGKVRVAPGLAVESGFAWNDGRVTRPSPELLALFATGPESSMRIPNIARVVARGAVDWTHDLSPRRRFEANLFVRYVGRSRLGIGPHLGEAQGDYVDSGLNLRLADGPRSLTLGVTNLADSVGNRFAFGTPIETGAGQITPLKPRTVRLGFEQAF